MKARRSGGPGSVVLVAGVMVAAWVLAATLDARPVAVARPSIPVPSLTPPALPAPRLRRRPLRRLTRRAVGFFASLVLVATPVTLFLRGSLPQDRSQIAPPAVSFDAATAARFATLPAYADAVPVLAYHEIAESGGPLAISPTELARQMAMLRLAGANAITADQFQRFMRGDGTLPPRPVLITFDDGTFSTWQAADPILERYGMHAVAFVITGKVEPKAQRFLSEPELRDLQESGRWDLESHTSLGHGLVTAGPDGHQAPFLTNRQWLRSEDRMETLDEYARRVAGDLDASIAQLAAVGASPSLFAYPPSSDDSETNDPRVLPILRRLVEQRFPVSFLDSDSRGFVERGAALQAVERFRVTPTMSATQLFDELAANAPRPPAGNLARDAADWAVDQGALRSSGLQVDGGGLSLRPPTRAWMSLTWMPGKSAVVREGTLHLDLDDLGTAAAGAAVTLRLLPTDDGPTPPSVTVGPTTARITGGPELQCRLEAASSHHVDLTVADGLLTLQIDGAAADPVPFHSETGVRVGLGAWRDQVTSPDPRVTALRVIAKPAPAARSLRCVPRPTSSPDTSFGSPRRR